MRVQSAQPRSLMYLNLSQQSVLNGKHVKVVFDLGPCVVHVHASVCVRVNVRVCIRVPVNVILSLILNPVNLLVELTCMAQPDTVFIIWLPD